MVGHDEYEVMGLQKCHLERKCELQGTEVTSRSQFDTVLYHLGKKVGMVSPGAHVQLEGLAAVQFNGSKGIVVEWIDRTCKWQIKLELSGELKSVRAHNLRMLSDVQA